ncbi:hypothetical protein H8B20_21050 [Pseudomonas sp. P42]|nr:hypothetical protein [Pseudomonas sp. P42]
MALVYRQEYSKTMGSDKAPTVLLPQECLVGALPEAQSVEDVAPYYFFPTVLKRQMSETALAFGSKSMSAWV